MDLHRPSFRDETPLLEAYLANIDEWPTAVISLDLRSRLEEEQGISSSLLSTESQTVSGAQPTQLDEEESSLPDLEATDYKCHECQPSHPFKFVIRGPNSQTYYGHVYDDMNTIIVTESIERPEFTAHEPLADDITAPLADDTTALLADDTTALLADDTTALLADDTTALLADDTTALLADDTTALLADDTTALLADDTTALLAEGGYAFDDDYLPMSELVEDEALASLIFRGKLSLMLC
ncbi:hypothetical protein ADUPG1_011621 [Aduncisulcus paluster]|uniref:Uncharacterized protein n=1 Tax=Aduncisulcus paluster TaxID=2918883 RepID=A0ABQ5JWF3_9EUKA|nr:hypothetical protein ADUPG1_011621 [Aduncisulcus paluster]